MGQTKGAVQVGTSTIRNHIKKRKITPRRVVVLLPPTPLPKTTPFSCIFNVRKIQSHGRSMCVCHACYMIMSCASYFYARAAPAANFCFMRHKICLLFARLTINNGSSNTHCCVLALQAGVVKKTDACTSKGLAQC